MDRRELKRIHGSTLLVTGLLFIAIGIVVVLHQNVALQSILWFGSCILILSGTLQIVFNLMKKEKKGMIPGLLTAALGALFILFPVFVTAIPVVLFGLYCMVLSIIRFVSFYLNHKNQVPGNWVVLAGALVLLAFGVLFVLCPVANIASLAAAIGWFFIFYGLTYVSDSLHEALDTQRTANGKRRFRVTLPMFMVATVPSKVWSKINERIRRRGEDADLVTEIDKTGEEPDLEICIHVGLEGLKRFGHVDIIYNGVAMSYGSYDETTYKLDSAIADGVFYETARDPYIQFCTTYNEKTIFVFGLKLSEEQKAGVERQLEKMKKIMVPWTPAGPDKNPYANELLKAAPTRFYKFTKGSFKTYFVVNTNCVKFADTIIGPSGIDILTMTGIITPGTYYEYFENQFKRQSSNVISKTLYPVKGEEKQDTR